jgi:hypothetical protein
MAEKLLTYDPEDWLRDATWVAERGREGPGSADKWAAVIAYFERKYGPAAEWHHERLITALGYFASHTEEFDDGLLSIAYSTGGIASSALLLALCKIYSDADDDQLGSVWPVDQVKALARKIDKIRD